MAKIKKAYFCKECGFEAPKWLGHCPSCGAWNSFTEEVIARAMAAPAEAGEDPLRGVYLETFCAWLPELSGMAGV